jgi:hypothetical protein
VYVAGFAVVPRLCEPVLEGGYLNQRLEIKADASRDKGVAPVVDVVGIVEVGFKLEIAQLVSAFDVPAAEVVADDAADGVSVIEIGIEEGLSAVGRGMEARGEFWSAFDAGEDAIGGSEFVLHEAGSFEQFHMIAVEDLSAVGDDPRGEAGRRNEAMNLNVKTGGKMLAEVKRETAIDGLLGGVVGSILGPAEFAAGDDIGAVLAVGAFHRDDFGVDGADCATGARLSAETVGGFTEVDADGSALSIGRKRSEKRAENYCNE